MRLRWHQPVLFHLRSTSAIRCATALGTTRGSETPCKISGAAHEPIAPPAGIFTVPRIFDAVETRLIRPFPWIERLATVASIDWITAIPSWRSALRASVSAVSVRKLLGAATVWQIASETFNGPRKAFSIFVRKGPDTDAIISSTDRPAVLKSKLDCRDPDRVSSGFENSNCASCSPSTVPLILVICGAMRCVPAARSLPQTKSCLGDPR